MLNFTFKNQTEILFGKGQQVKCLQFAEQAKSSSTCAQLRKWYLR